jgi:limonene-1,2-epoxide hydrolase
MDDPVGRVVAALESRDWDAVRPLLHPYLRWTDRTGQTIQGRTKVLALLRRTARTGPPARYELRDGQIYRWTEV